MALPVVNAPKHTTVLPFSKKKIEYRAFLVKEEKLMLIANESKEQKDVIEAIAQVVESCTFGKVDVNTLSKVDFEWLLVKMRQLSKGNEVSFGYKCKNEVDGKECGHVTEVGGNLEKIEYRDENESNAILLDGDIGVKMRMLSIADAEKYSAITEGEVGVDDVFNLVAECIESVFDAEQVWEAKDTPRQELIDFIENLSPEQFSKIQEWFLKMPRLVLEIGFKCEKCGHTEKVELEGIDSFFG